MRFAHSSVVRTIVLLSLCGAGEVAAQNAPVTELDQLFAEAWEFALVENPLLATWFGDARFNDRLPTVSVADAERRAKTRRGFLDRLARIDRATLRDVDRVNYDVFQRELSDELQSFEFHAYLMPITNRSGFHIDFPELPREVPLRSGVDYENYIARLAAFGAYADQHIVIMREGIRQGFVLPAIVLEDYDVPIKAQIVEDPTRSILYGPLAELAPTEGITEADVSRLRESAGKAIAESVVPGYQRFFAFMRDEYVPACRGTIAVEALPNGRPYYRFLVKMHTTTELSPDEVHQIGLSEVARIDEEMRGVMRQAKFEGNFSQFVAFLRTDEQFYVETPEALLKEVSLVLKRIDGELPKLFKTLPRTPYGIREVPAYIAPLTTTAYYMPPAADGSRAGFYYVNTYNLKVRPLYEIEALSLHEAVPGHHLQIARQQELEGLPPFRRYAGFTAMVEGWGLYAERLGLEIGFYRDPYRDFGRLSYEMWRACRLVVDSGMHHLGWTREQAIQFMADHTALTLHNIRAEVDRYIAWPGQALAYKIGELKIRELRRKAEEQLADRFDVREFHDVVLGSGSVPLNVLEQNVAAYIDRVRGSKIQAAR